MSSNLVGCANFPGLRGPPIHVSIHVSAQRQSVERGCDPNLTRNDVAERAGVSRLTCMDLEAGKPGVSIAALVRYLSVLGHPDRIAELLEADPIGGNLEQVHGRNRLIVYVTVDRRPVPAGAITIEGGGRTRPSRFAYARSWLENGFPISPVLPLRSRAMVSAPYELPLTFYDAAPDGWGRGVLTAAFPQQFFGMASGSRCRPIGSSMACEITASGGWRLAPAFDSFRLVTTSMSPTGTCASASSARLRRGRHRGPHQARSCAFQVALARRRCVQSTALAWPPVSRPAS